MSIPVLTQVRKLRQLLRTASAPVDKVVQILYASIDRLYELSGYKINRDFYRKFTAYTLHGIVALTITLFMLIALSNIVAHLLVQTITLSVAFTLFLLLVAVAGLYAYPFILVHRRAVHFNERVLYTLANMIPLVATNATLVEVISKVYELERDPEIKHELGLILKDCALGTDILTAIQRSIDRVPSLVYRDVMSTLIESVKLSQDPVRVLMQKLDALLRGKLLRLRQVTITLTLLFQTYVVLAFLGPALIIVIYAAFSLSLAGLPAAVSSVPGLSAVTQITPPIGDVFGVTLLLTLFYSPLIAAVFYILFDSIMSTL